MAQQTDSFEFKDENARFGIKDEWINKPLHIGGQKQQTAVEWLYERFLFAGYAANSEWKEQAKQMEKEQMFRYIERLYINGDASYEFHKKEFEQYYNATYKIN